MSYDEKTNGVHLHQSMLPNHAKKVSAFLSINHQQATNQTESLLHGNYVDRRKQFDQNNQFMIRFDTNQPQVDFGKYVLKLTMKFGQQYFVGTGTVINIQHNTLYILTCAHNLCMIDDIEQKKFNASHVWCNFNGKDVPCTKYHIYYKYDINQELGNDIAVIECKMNSAIMFYQTFPVLQDLSAYKSDQYISTSQQQRKQMENERQKKVVGVMAGGLGGSVTVGAYIGSVAGPVGTIAGASVGVIAGVMSGLIFGSVAVGMTGNAINRSHKKEMNKKFKRKVEYEMCVCGYPGEKNGTFWGMIGTASILKNKHVVAYNIDTTGGQSGSPILLDNRIVGVHTNGDFLGLKKNYGTYLDKSMLRWMYKIKVDSNMLEKWRPLRCDFDDHVVKDD
eukprot:150450_1